jgi:hypothetical protein
MEVGTRKFKAWLITEIIICLVFGFALFKGVEFKADNIQLIIVVAASLSGAFFTANFGEHYSKAIEKK